jgi:hypothetical protein
MRSTVEAEERAAQRRYGPSVGIGGTCEHPDNPRPFGSNSVSTYERWEELKSAKPKSQAQELMRTGEPVTFQAPFVEINVTGLQVGSRPGML